MCLLSVLRIFWVNRLKQRAANRKYTPAQEAAWARAANSIRSENRSWWGSLSNAFQDMMEAAGGSSAGIYTDDVQVRHSRCQYHTSMCQGWHKCRVVSLDCPQTAMQTPSMLHD